MEGRSAETSVSSLREREKNSGAAGMKRTKTKETIEEEETSGLSSVCLSVPHRTCAPRRPWAEHRKRRDTRDACRSVQSGVEQTLWAASTRPDSLTQWRGRSSSAARRRSPFYLSANCRQEAPRTRRLDSLPHIDVTHERQTTGKNCSCSGPLRQILQPIVDPPVENFALPRSRHTNSLFTESCAPLLS